MWQILDSHAFFFCENSILSISSYSQFTRSLTCFRTKVLVSLSNPRVIAYLSRVLEVAFTALEGLNKQAFLTELVRR